MNPIVELNYLVYQAYKTYTNGYVSFIHISMNMFYLLLKHILMSFKSY